MQLSARMQGLERRLARVEEALQLRTSPSDRAPATDPSAGEGHVLAGQVQESLVADVLQLVTSNGMTGVFVVQSEIGTFRLHFFEGEIHDAEGPGAQGESAVFGALVAETGRFHFDARSGPPAKRTIEANTQFLVLEALRQIDEKRALHEAEPEVTGVIPAPRSGAKY